jgi:HKD family nuclease
MELTEHIIQGLTTSTHAHAVERLFKVKEIQRSLISVAFVSSDGVDHIANSLAASHVTVFAGIRNGITSFQGLDKLRGLTDALYVVDTGSRTILFHPKLFLVRGKAAARVLIGSANLTLGGLNNNVEAGVLLEFDLANPPELSVVDDIERAFYELPLQHPKNVLSIKSRRALLRLFLDGRVIDEAAVPAPHPTTIARGGDDDVPTLILKVERLGGWKGTRKPLLSKQPPVHTPSKASSGVEFELLWRSKPLTRRDLTIPEESGTHQTGSINLDKGLLTPSTDHRSFFRREAFEGVTWKPNKSGAVEHGVATFQVVIKGVSHGDFRLELSHTTSTTSKAYLQRNAMTRLRWGSARKLVARDDFIGRTLSLYRDTATRDRFLLDID